MRKKEAESPFDFLKGNDSEFNAAMNSINDMYSDLFKTIDFHEGAISDPQNLEKFEPIEEMWKDMMGLDEGKKEE